MTDISNRIVTPEFRMAFPHLLKPRAVRIGGQEKGDPKYSLEMIFDTSDEAVKAKLDEMKQLAVRVAKEKWPNRDIKSALQTPPAEGGILWPFRSGDAENRKRDNQGKKVREELSGTVTIRANSTAAPGVFDAQRREILDEKRVYGGAYGYAELSCVAGNAGDTDYLKFYVNMVMVSRDGDKLGGRDVKEVFAGIEGGEADVDPGGDFDDEIPF